jgi:NAD(P)-dependent dehydrogenase (short-subunit alcohol dehydrogenase family)
MSQVAPRGVLITGCSSGIGRATAQHLARGEFVVYATVRREEDARALSALDTPGLVPVWPLDLSEPDGIPAIRRQVESDLERRGLPGLYALIHNAGGGQVAPIELMALDRFRTELHVRVLGATALVQAFLPSIRRAHGRILWIVTPAAVPTPYVSSIHACDFAANCLARTLAIELKPWKVPSIQIRCGGIRTETGLRTGAEVEAILRHPNAELYRRALEDWGREMAAFDARRTDPVEVARTVERALLALRPRRRYAIGHMARLAAILEALPQPLADAILATRF